MKFGRMGNSFANTYKENSYELTDQTVSAFDGKFSKFSIKQPCSAMKNDDDIVATVAGKITILIYDTCDDTVPQFSINTYIDNDIHLHNNFDDTHSHKICSIQFENRDRTVPGLVWGYTIFHENILTIKLEGYDNETIVSTRPFSVFDGYPDELFCRASPIDYQDLDPRY